MEAFFTGDVATRRRAKHRLRAGPAGYNTRRAAPARLRGSGACNRREASWV